MTAAITMQLHVLDVFNAASGAAEGAAADPVERVPMGGALRARIAPETLARRWGIALADAADPAGAAVRVAPAFMVHAEPVRPRLADLATAPTDQAARRPETGAGLYYAHVAVDVPRLVARHGGDALWAARRLKDVVTRIAAGAHDTGAGLVMVEAGQAPARSLAEAFHTPTDADLDAAVAALAGLVEQIDATCPAGDARVGLTRSGHALPGMAAMDAAALAAWVEDQVQAHADAWCPVI
ncbi:hypothetical protein CCR80_08530 [Rhodothalassium salexigens]|uniref:type I-E CRISPR-associated protein Cas7/Cse4/CasC n=1 Tax=Rhodothalassium salexigens TaxID=1086 RepID=UPI0019123204|nr:type I-E CRISPR-associated protein Cas7/Cse4/CasC [Rhodothalassium salexigens]MBK5921076.1 hypothetical protein [Rhodothalassium salexigens]